LQNPGSEVHTACRRCTRQDSSQQRWNPSFQEPVSDKIRRRYDSLCNTFR